MGKKSLLALLMAAILLVTTGCALIEKDEAVDRATPIVTVYESVYTKGQVQDAVQSNLNYMAMMYYYYLGTNYDVKDPANIASTQESVINGFVEEGVKLHFAKEKGITAEKYADEIAEHTAADLAEAREDVIANYFADTELTGEALDKAVDAKMVEVGYSSAEYLKSIENEFLLNKLEEEIKATVTVTDADLQAELDAKVAADQEKYDADPAAWGTAMLNGTKTYYTPAGYRMVKNLLIKFSDEDQAAIDSAEGEEAKAAATAAALANLDEKADAALARLDAGEAFDTVMAEMTEDPGMQPGAANAATGYPVCEASSNWDPAFKDAAMALEKVGDYSGKVAGSYGYYIIGYASDVTPGAVTLDEERDNLYDTVLTTKQNDLWSSTVSGWVDGAKSQTKIDTSSLK